VVALLLALATSAGLVACTYSWDLPADAGTDAATANPDASSAIADGATTDAGTLVDSGSIACKTMAECPPGFQCFFSDARCGKGVPGRCESTTGALANACSGGAITPGVTRYCGCNGQTYSSGCALIEAGTTLNADGCGSDPGYMTCGYLECDTATSFCIQRHSASPPYGCGSWAGCGAKNCTCSTWQTACVGVSGTCATNASTGTTVTCP
jgi:hypothetical protein